MPGVPVLVVDDCSGDATVSVADEAGARVLPLPYHLGLGGCVQAGYRLAFELGYDYVIRVDGDGQHDPRDIPKILEALRAGRLRDGDRIAIRERQGPQLQRLVALGWNRLLPRRSAAHSGQVRCAIRPPDSWA